MYFIYYIIIGFLIFGWMIVIQSSFNYYQHLFQIILALNFLYHYHLNINHQEMNHLNQTKHINNTTKRKRNSTTLKQNGSKQQPRPRLLYGQSMFIILLFHSLKTNTTNSTLFWRNTNTKHSFTLSTNTNTNNFPLLLHQNQQQQHDIISTMG